MKTVSMLKLGLHAQKIIGQLQKGERMILTRRGKPVARLEPVLPNEVSEDDPFFTLGDLGNTQGQSLDNAQIDDIVSPTRELFSSSTLTRRGRSPIVRTLFFSDAVKARGRHRLTKREFCNRL
jgi:antitoxin (DNA-binding transcriptional repressor) of toxin-antitoxin stability system